MTWNSQLDALFSHIVSQWTYRWLALPHRAAPGSPRLELSALTLPFCLAYLQQRWDPLLPHLPWMERVERKQLSLQALASLLYEQVQKITQAGAHLLDVYHPQYPEILRHIADAPNALTLRGNLSLLERPAVAIVGSRKASGFALQQAFELGGALARQGLVIVSGGALGCDMAGHLGAFRSGLLPAPTVIVFAGGLAQLHPRCHNAHFAAMEQAGALLISERLWDYPARPFDFPTRNRLISGLSPRLLVMQAKERSGAGLTASAALHQGREVYVMVHPEEDVRAYGSQRLLDDGAIPFLSALDYLSLPVALT